MKSPTRHNLGALAFVLAVGLCLLPLGTASAGPLDFTAAEYQQHGIDSNKLQLLDSPGLGQEINVITGGFNNAGDIIFYTANTGVFLDSFTTGPDGKLDAAGQEALDIAETFVAWLFPLKAGIPLSPAPPNRRQDNIFDTRGGYFSNNPLGLWKLEFIQWLDDSELAAAGLTADAIADCADMRADLLEKNGPSLDGNQSPVFRTSSEVRNAIARQCVSALNRPAAKQGEGGFRWVT